MKAILWDNDGILVDTERLYFDACREALSTFEVKLTEDLYRELSLVQGASVFSLLEARGVGAAEIDRARLERDEIYYRLLCESDVRIPGIEETLEQLHGEVVMGIITGSRRRHFETIHEDLGLLRYFDFIITHEDYLKSKPDPESFLLGIEKSGYEARECLAIEDSPRGVQAAKSAGLECWAIPQDLTRDCDFTLADRVLDDVHELAEKVLNDR